MNSIKKFLLTGVLAVGIAVSSMVGVANAQTLSCGEASLNIDVPYKMTKSDASAKTESKDGQRFTLNTAMFSSSMDKNASSGVIAIGFDLVTSGSIASKITMTDFYNDPEFMNDIKSNIKSSLEECGLKVPGFTFRDVTFNGLQAKAAEATATVDDATGDVDALILLKGNAIWVVCVIAPDHASVQKIINTIN